MFSRVFFDIIVVGGGHAGVEAAYISAKSGVKTLLITDDLNTIGKLSCNPAIGGVGKSQLVCEVDGFGGLIGKVANLSGVHFRLLNSSKGAAVQSVRIQVNSYLYKNFILSFLCSQHNLFFLESTVDSVLIITGAVGGVILCDGKKIFCKSLILATGTFLKGTLVVGNSFFNGGRIGDQTSTLLFKNLRYLFTNVCRFKTGTPPRIAKDSVNFNVLSKQCSGFPMYFSTLFTQRPILLQDVCFFTNTTSNTHEVVRKNLYKTALYKGTHISLGPRYCLSIEDKVIRFDKNSHQIFLETDGINYNHIYLNGLSTSAPLSIQYSVLRSIRGLERSKVVFPGYMVEYDCFDPKDLSMTLETKIKGLFFVGQLNGTTGYEEAAAQGFIAGYNSSNYILNKQQWVPDMKKFFIGVLLYDLTNIGVIEPYRMFTSRSENRLDLRQDNVSFRCFFDSCLFDVFLVDFYVRFVKKRCLFSFFCLQTFKKFFYFYEKSLFKKILNINSLLKQSSVTTLLVKKVFFFSYILLNYIFLMIFNYFQYDCYKRLSQKVVFSISKRFLYTRLPLLKDYFVVKGLSNEVVERLNFTRPYIIRQVVKIFGVTPMSIYLIFIFIQKLNKNNVFF